MAGCQTAVSNIVISVVVLLTVKFLTPLFEYTPNANLSSIIISTVIGLIDYDVAILIWKIDKLDSWRVWERFLVNIRQYPEAAKIPDVLIVRVDSAIYSSNSNYKKERILRWLTEEEDNLKAKYEPRIEFLIVEMSPVTDTDTSGIHAFEEIHRSLQKRDVQ
ncbi:hypothetical protein L2E82_20324 [Cichorium intybus]|uniref:Uncharacterized protein n=1 Tax=Cichorium intybus TaxID=13427 RepID=A0ACB9DSN4_CICIN|nr:hypothetical protein L2E82_20324 [Cichorium intybus]